MSQDSTDKTSKEASRQKQKLRIPRRPSGCPLKSPTALQESRTDKMAVNTTMKPSPDISKSSKMRPWYPVLLLVAVLGAAALGALLVSWGSTSNDLSRNFADSNQFDEFTALVAGLVGVSVAVAAFTWPTFWRIRAQVGRSPLIAAILSHFSLRIGILYAFVLAAGSASFCGLILLAYIQREKTGSSDTRIADTIRSILETRIYMQRFFIGAAVLITMAVIVVGGLQSALSVDLKAYQLNYNHGYITSIPNIASLSVGTVLLYGIFFAALLAFAIIPSYTAWQGRAADLRDRLYPVHDDSHASQDWYDGRSNIETLLHMRPGFGSTFLTVLGIIAPLIGSIILIVVPAVSS
jgi:hypothetical protein